MQETMDQLLRTGFGMCLFAGMGFLFSILAMMTIELWKDLWGRFRGK